MAYFAWHKLSRRLPDFAPGASGCTFACCCPIEFYSPVLDRYVQCGGETPGSCPAGDPFNCAACEPYDGTPPPQTWDIDEWCCLECDQATWCPQPPYRGYSYTLGVCYQRNMCDWSFCQPWSGTISSDGSISWTRNTVGSSYNFNCSGLDYGSNDTQQGPLTTRLSLGDRARGGTGAFNYSYANDTSYTQNNRRQKDPTFSVPGLGDGTARYYSSPAQPGVVPLENIHASQICFRMKIPSSVPSRTIVLSGYNRYRYTGYLSGDNLMGDFGIPKIVSDPGASGLSEMEGSLGRSFPLSDVVVTYPLWGGTTAYSVYDWENCGAECRSGMLQAVYGGRTGDFCIGDECLEVQPNNSATGHYLSMVAGNLTGHYHSFSGFNPYVKYWETASEDYLANGEPWSYTEPYAAYNNGTGLPPCSLFSLAWALYDRSWRVLLDSNVVGTTAHSSEQGIYDAYTSSFGNVRNKLNSLLSDDPRNLTGAYGESVVTYWFDQLNNAITGFYEDYFANEINPTMPSYYNSDSSPKTKFGAFTTPKVILWDKAAFLNASTNAARWQSLYIPGSGNILFDSGCTHTNNNWKAYRFMVDEASHDMAWGSTHAARMIQFRVCDRSSDQISAQTYNSITDNRFYQGTFCEMCATSGSPFGMTADMDCVTGPFPETWGDYSVGTDYQP